MVAALNHQQLEAVKHLEGPLLILAGAGSGKTRVIVHRIVYLMEKYFVPAQHILAVTFTNKAANEMKNRIQDMLTETPGQRISIGTFHSFCVRVLRNEYKKLGLIASFTIADESDQLARIKRAIRRAGYSSEKVQPRSVLDAVSSAKNAFMKPSEFQENQL